MFAASKTAAAAAGTPPASTDPQFNYVTMLLHGDGTNGAQNNTFVDSSTNNFTITRNGTPTQGSFSPYGTLWSNYFSGSGQYADAPANAAFAFGTGDFSIEYWAYSASWSASPTVVDLRTIGTAADGYSDYYSTAGKFNLYWGTSTVYTSTANVSLNAWNHIAVTRSGTTVRVFINGIQDGTFTSSFNFGQNSCRIAANKNTTPIVFTGYLSNLRIVKGTALYTSNFTPSTTPLTAVSGTSLLTCQSNRFRDNSSNNFAITVTGTPSVQRFSPFDPAAEYSTSVIGGSGYFNGSTDYLSLASNAAFGVAGAFTYEAWIYPFSWTSTSTQGTTLYKVPTSGGMQIGNSSSGGGWGIASAGVAWQLRTSTPPVLNAWNHVVISRNGSNSTAIFLNGVRLASGSVTASFTASSVIISDGTSGAQFNGYMSNARLVNGTAVYDPTQTTLTIPTAPLTAITNTSLLLNCVNAGIVDNAMMNDLVTVGNAQVSTSVKKYGTGSMYFDGTGDYLTFPAGQNTAFGTGDFTVEMWFFRTATTAATYYLIDNRNASQTGTWAFLFDNTAWKMSWYNGSSSLSSGVTPANNQWNHVAYSRSGTTGRLFLNGTQIASWTDTNNYSISSTIAYIGARYSANEVLEGYIDDLRITKGVARYTANFTPPTAPFPNN